jgi:hypothetical protein
MIFQFLATLTLGAALALVLLRSFSFAALKAAIAAALALGIYFVWFPDQLTLVANRLGIGRGADLVSYLSTLVLLLFIVGNSIRARRIERQLTLLSRHIALSGAASPEDRAD